MWENLIRLGSHKILTVLLAFCCVPTVYGSSQKTYAVLVAVADYQMEKPKMDLRFTLNDISKFREYLLSEQGGKIPAENISYLTDSKASKATILASAKYIFSKAKSTDKVIFYFSGHGFPGGFLAVDYNGISGLLFYDEVKEIFRNCEAGTKLLIADACFSGSLKTQTLKTTTEVSSKKAFHSSDIVVMLSCRPEETSLELQAASQGLFSYFLIKGLEGLADGNKDGKITILELHGYVAVKTRETAALLNKRQHPMTIGHFDKNLIIGGMI